MRWSVNKQQIIDLETRFWQALKDDDVPAAQDLLAEDSILASPMGAKRVSPQAYGELASKGQFKLDQFKMSDVEVTFPKDDVAVIAYQIRETGEMNGKPMDLQAADSTVWVRDGGSWKCALHTESIMDPEFVAEPA